MNFQMDGLSVDLTADEVPVALPVPTVSSSSRSTGYCWVIDNLSALPIYITRDVDEAAATPERIPAGETRTYGPVRWPGATPHLYATGPAACKARRYVQGD